MLSLQLHTENITLVILRAGGYGARKYRQMQLFRRTAELSNPLNTIYIVTLDVLDVVRFLFDKYVIKFEKTMLNLTPCPPKLAQIFP